MKRDPIDILLQLAYLEGEITTHGAYEQSVAKKRYPVFASDASAMRERLETALRMNESREEVPLTVGVFLRGVRLEQSLRTQEIFTRLGLSQNIYRMLENDRISPLKISVQTWRKLRQLFNLSSDVLAEMIRHTHQLVWFRPSFRTTLARYDSTRQKGMKATTLEKAATELYTKAQLSLPSDQKAKLDRLLKTLSEDI
jgi:transcriptional regulator with XRE-family HTH domain